MKKDGNSNDSPKLISLYQLIMEGESIAELVNRIESSQFVTEDEFGRSIRIPIPGLAADDRFDELRKIVLDALAKVHDYKRNSGPFSKSLAVAVGGTDFRVLHASGWFETDTTSLGEGSPAVNREFKALTRMDDWACCLRDAWFAFKSQHGCNPSEGQLWAALHGDIAPEWHIKEGPKPSQLVVGSDVIDRENFKKRFDRLFPVLTKPANKGR